jgi:hypothetical protein
VGVFLLTLALVAIGASWVLTRQQPESVSAVHPEAKTATSERTTPSTTKPTMSLPAEDVPGKDVPALPRYPGSVRIEYERKEQDLLLFAWVMYLSRARVDVIRGFYRGVFRAQGWEVANAEFSEGEWTFLVVHGEREVEVRMEPYRRGVTRIVMELSEPLPQNEDVPKKTLQKREANPTPQEPVSTESPQPATPIPVPPSASPASQSVSPTPAPQPASAPDDDFYEGGRDDGDDLGGDGGGDD